VVIREHTNGTSLIYYSRFLPVFLLSELPRQGRREQIDVKRRPVPRLASCILQC
jgi:hypothetical protein